MVANIQQITIRVLGDSDVPQTVVSQLMVLEEFSRLETSAQAISWGRLKQNHP